MDNKRQQKILLVDDAPDTIEVLKRNLENKNYEVYISYSVQEAIKILKKEKINLVITDYKMPGANGFELIKYVKENHRNTEVMMITGYATIEGAVNAVKSGAEEYLSKPFTDEELYKAVERALTKLNIRLSDEADISDDEFFGGIWGKSERVIRIRKEIKCTANKPEPVLIIGPPGTEIDETAYSIHSKSDRKKYRFCEIDFERFNGKNALKELSGFKLKKSNNNSPGLIELSDKGTLYFKNINYADDIVIKFIFAFLKTGKYSSIKKNRCMSYSGKLLFGTETELQELFNKGKLSSEFFLQISKCKIMIPSLKDRHEDIPLIAAKLAGYFSVRYSVQEIKLSSSAIRLLLEYEWINNSAEIKSLIKFLTLNSAGKIIDAPDLPAIMKSGISESRVYDKTLGEIEKDYIKNVLNSVRNNKSKAAEILGIDRKTIREKLK